MVSKNIGKYGLIIVNIGKTMEVWKKNGYDLMVINNGEIMVNNGPYGSIIPCGGFHSYGGA